MIFDKWKPQRIFLVLGLVVGVLLTVITPPMGTPDESSHFINAYSISRGDIFPEVVDGNIGRYVSQGVLDFRNVNSGKLDGKLEEKYTFTEFYYNSWLLGAPTNDVFYGMAQAIISPLGYAFSAFGMAVGSFLLKGIDQYALPYNLLLFGRFFNLAFYIICTFFAIKTTPYFKNTMTILGLMPMSIYLGASINYDAIVIPICMLLFAIILKILCSDEGYIISKKDIIVVFASIFLLLGIKLAYAPFLLIFLAIPIKKFGTKKRYIILITSTIAIAIIAMIPTLIINGIASDYISPYAPYVSDQKEYVMSHLLELPHILFNTLQLFDVFYIASFFGKLGQLDINFPLPIIALFYIALGYVTLVDACNAKNVNWKARVFSLGAGVICILGIFFAMYLNWTSFPGIGGIGVDYVTGVQGRYFIPMFLFLCIPFFNSLLEKVKFKGKILVCSEMTMQVTVVICSILTIFTVYSRFW